MFLQYHSIEAQKDFFIDEGVIAEDEGVNEGVNTLLDLIRTEPGLNARTLAAKTGKSLSTTERHIRKLKYERVIEFRGAPKNGGYYPIS
ncbi:winged helix-turn-helix transcriptional regulator [Methanorbis rubei]|uniref:winged helix-turn-helix transcriptional regulator n=1 Tax=Methanorbis rubei TaxID=3028300 RepID=UPI003B846950